MAQYIHDNTDDEFTHFTFLNAYLTARGGKPVDLDPFRTLPEQPGDRRAEDRKRLTNLMELTVDTSWWTRYRSCNKNPDLGDTFPQAVPGLLKGKFPAIPRSDADLMPEKHLQAIANTAGFHFATIEQGGTSLYPSLAQRVSDPEVLRVLLSIGPTETMHFQTWSDKAGNAPPLTDPTNGLVFPDLNKPPFGGELFQTNLIMPEPTIFLSRKFPRVLDHPPDRDAGRGDGSAQVPDRRRPVPRPVQGVFRVHDATRKGGRRGSAIAAAENQTPEIRGDPMGRGGLEPPTLGLRVPCSTS